MALLFVGFGYATKPNTTVVTMDSDLAAVPGLIIENWAETS
jgi:hypothetical protein